MIKIRVLYKEDVKIKSFKSNNQLFYFIEELDNSNINWEFV